MAQLARLRDSIHDTPRILDPAVVRNFRDKFGNEHAPAGSPGGALVDGVAACSPYLRRLMERDPSGTDEILGAPPELSIDAAITQLGAAASGPADMALACMRSAKDKAALAIALAEISGYWPVMAATAGLSRFADAAVEVALSLSLTAQSAPNKIPATCGIAVLAMGKHGAGELNYSSDIDLVVIYDADAMEMDALDAKTVAVRAARDIVNTLQTQTKDGFVFRTDLRLRPDPGVTPAAISVSAAELYYETHGQNWERAAYIKARAAAGDQNVGVAFLDRMRPFIWRKYLDFAAVEDIKSIKRQIHSAKGGGDITFLGHDLKIGRGGIREVEFYAQTQQLILGGKNPALRLRCTLDALSALAEHGVIESQVREDLSKAYCTLRRIEHRLQMVADEQTHKIPLSEDGVSNVAAFLGMSTETFRSQVEDTLNCVHGYFADLFSYDDSLATDFGSLVFTGVENDAETLATLTDMGFSRSADISNAIRRWHTGGLRATNTARARELLTAFTPALLSRLAAASDPDASFFAFAEFLAALPSGVQVFSLFANNHEVFDSLIEIMTISPFLGRELSRRHNFIEQLIEADWGGVSLDPKDCDSALADALSGVDRYEDVLNAVRRWAGEQKFPVTAQLALGAIDANDAAQRYTAIADASIRRLSDRTLALMGDLHGEIDGALCVIAMGRLGAAEMTATSDLDLLFVYDAPADAASTGERSLLAGEYFARAVRRIVTALSAATEEGGLYEVDMQLRPSGRSGPAAVSYTAFQRYYAEDAWTWEKMALCKARVIAGPEALANRINTEIEGIFTAAKDNSDLAADVAEMRERLAAAKPATDIWDVKHADGGLTEIGFVCQFLALAKGARPPQTTRDAILRHESAGLLGADETKILLGAYEAFESIIHFSRAAHGEEIHGDGLGKPAQDRLVKIMSASTFADAQEKLHEHKTAVAQIYRSVINR